MSVITCFIYFDACKYDYINVKYTPFLHSLKINGHVGRVQTVAGFTQGTTMVTGKYPVESNKFTWYQYDQQQKQFGWIKPFKKISKITKFKFYIPFKVVIRLITKFISRDVYPDPAFIPLDFLPYFKRIDLESDEKTENLYFYCEKYNINYFSMFNIYKIVKSAKCQEIFSIMLKSLQNDKPYDLYCLHIGELDELGHKYGPHPELFKNKLFEIDLWIKKIFNEIIARGYDCNLIISSDHGMKDVVGTINIENRLKRLNLKKIKDYIYFLDSTLVRFWFKNKTSKYLIKKMLSKIPYGHIITNKEKEKLHINFKHNLYGDLFFWLDEGYMVFPNFFQPNVSELPKGMHGYKTDNDGLIIIYSTQKSFKKNMIPNPLPLVEILTLILNFLGINK